MKLTDLEPHFLKIVDPKTFQRIDNLSDADGIEFLCPKCLQNQSHSVICWFEGKVPNDMTPGPGRWNPMGTGYSDLSFVPGKRSHSVQLMGGCNWHGIISNGDVSLT